MSTLSLYLYPVAHFHHTLHNLCPHKRRFLSRQACTDPSLKANLCFSGASPKTRKSVAETAISQSPLVASAADCRQAETRFRLCVDPVCTWLVLTAGYSTVVRTCLINGLRAYSVEDRGGKSHEFVEYLIYCYVSVPWIGELKVRQL
jgi:hypothetical protein